MFCCTFCRPFLSLFCCPCHRFRCRPCPPFPAPTWRHRFTDGNDGFFLGGTHIADNADGTITVSGTAHTWFNGRKAVWPRGGFYTGVKVFLDPDDFSEGEFFTWSSSIDNTAGAYLSESFTHVRKLNGEIRVCANNNGSSPGLNLACAESEHSAAIPSPGFYTLVTRYFARDGYLYSRAIVANHRNRIIYRSPARIHVHFTGGIWLPIPIEIAGGHGYGCVRLDIARQRRAA
ncbi:MAG: hypothetical protein FWD58_00350 [Firmicutes bacterium]|nr:hypothetical protein [Bacillota bacterium]